MIKIILTLLFVGLSAKASIFPPGTKIEVPQQKSLTGGLTQVQVDQILGLFRVKFANDFKARGYTIRYINRWESNEFNAYAGFVSTGSLRDREIVVLGGLSRHSWITYDAMKMVVCHEVGHHIGGAPMYTGNYFSSEGQSDYYAALKCFRRLHTTLENSEWYRKNRPTLKTFNICKNDINCMRSVEAARVLMMMLSYGTVDVDTPETEITPYTLTDDYPTPQCRLDTYVAGTLYHPRPECWFRQ